jgi:predicted DNA-binding protein YlxM (UPF0122 family)
MEPYYVVGFVDGRATFKVGRVDRAMRFEVISENRRILEEILDLFGVGRISTLKRGGGRGELYRLLVTGKNDLLKIVEFFDKFPLVVKKEEYAEFREGLSKSMEFEVCTLSPKERNEVYELYTSGVEVEEIMKRYRMSKQRVYNVALYERRKAGETSRVRRLTGEQKREICRLYEEGYSTKSIADKYGKKKATILNVLSRSGIIVDRGYQAQKRREIS